MGETVLIEVNIIAILHCVCSNQLACYTLVYITSNDTRFLSKTQLIMINQSNAGRFDPKVFVNCIQDDQDDGYKMMMMHTGSCTQLTKTFGSKRPAFD